MDCNCGKELVWGGCDTYEDYGVEGQGIVTNYSCINDECSMETVYTYESIILESNED